MAKIVMIADDLTGAADCAAACAGPAVSVTVVLHRRGEKEPALFQPDVDIVSIDANTRCLAAEEAAEKTAELIRCFEESVAGSGAFLFKKIDSTLRGNMAAELAAVLRTRSGPATGKKLSIVMAPALPAQGRTTVGGRQMVHGRPLEETDLWKSEVRAPQSDLSILLAEAGLPSRSIDVATVRSGVLRLKQTMENLVRQADVVVCDAETDEDLRAIAAASMGLNERMVWAGSAGLASQLLEAIGLECGESRSPRPVFSKGPTLFVVGSVASASREQSKALALIPDVVTVHVSSASLLNGEAASMPIVDGLRAGRDVLAVLDGGEQCAGNDAQLLAQEFSRVICPGAPFLGGLVATGGETARAILDQLGIRQLRVLGEVEPGLPFSVAHGWTRPLPVLTKAGGFGSSQTLVRCLEFLRKLERDSTRSRVQSPNVQKVTMQKPIVAITMGDAAGVGPEIIMKSLAHREVHELCRPLVIGDVRRLETAGQITGVKLKLRSTPVSGPIQAVFQSDTIDCVDLKLIPPDLPWGKLSREAGEAAYRYLEVAARLAMEGKVAAICTAPLNKEALHAAGHKFPGHTELLAHLTGTPEVSMMLSTPKMKVLHVTTHIGLLDAIARIEPGLVERTIARGHEALEKAGITNPRIGVCGINPHAGENGLFGRGEEEEKIVPAIAKCCARGWNVEGPLPADTLFYRAQRGDFDLVIAMYHDQGHGPVKVLGLELGVNITIGLPVVRTSVDHGTAFDIAGTGKADERSMLEALRQAVQLSSR